MLSLIAKFNFPFYIIYCIINISKPLLHFSSSTLFDREHLLDLLRYNCAHVLIISIPSERGVNRMENFLKPLQCSIPNDETVEPRAARFSHRAHLLELKIHQTVVGQMIGR